MSRARSATSRGASSGGRAPAGRPGVFVQTPKPDVYVAMLGVALGAMILGCLLLILILNRYGFSTKAAMLNGPAPTAIASLLEKSADRVSVHL